MIFLDEINDASRFVHKKTCVETALEARTSFLKWYRLSQSDINKLSDLKLANDKDHKSDYSNTDIVIFSRDMYGVHVLWQTDKHTYYDFWDYRKFSLKNKSLKNDEIIERFFKENMFSSHILFITPHEHHDIWILASNSDNVSDENTPELRIIND